MLFPTTVLTLNFLQIYEDTFDLNEYYVQDSSTKSEVIDNTHDPFEIIRNFNIEEYHLHKLCTALYNPPLTLKLFPKSNLYGHELIRYYDL